MPILEPLGKPGEPLSQGDLLKGVALFQTKPRSGGFDPARTEAEYSLVISRPCAVAHKERAVVAAVVKYTKQRPDFEDFEEACEFYDDARDGKSSPDLFYLGQIDGESGSYCARFDSLHTIEVPTDPAKREAFLAAHRVARLCGDFARDLHQRIFRAFAQLGFDDQKWYSTDDLLAIVMKGRIELAAAQGEVAETELKLHTGRTQAFAHPAEEGKLEKELEAKRKAKKKLEDRLKPLEDELASRDAPPANAGAAPLSKAVGEEGDSIRVD